MGALHQPVPPLVVADPLGMHADHLAQASRVGVEGGMSEETPDVLRRLTIEHVQEHQTVARMNEPALEVVRIVGKKGRAVNAVQDRDDLRVFDAGTGHFPGEPPELDTLATQ